MTPAARLAGAIEVLDQIAASHTPADEVLRAWGKARRFAGSGDRRAIAERVYAILRARTRLSWAVGAEDGRSLVISALRQTDALSLDEISALFSGEGHAPPPLTDAERGRAAGPVTPPPAEVACGLPPFAVSLFQAQFGDAWLAEALALTRDRAPLDLRVNARRGGVSAAVALLATDGVEPTRTPYSAWGLRLPADLAPDAARWRAFKTGWVEVQDEASQIAAALAGASPGMTVVDYCAGGGGKTLALGAAMRGEGRLIASDVSARRLAAIGPRLARADVSAAIRRLGPAGEGMEDLAGAADLVFVDAPCSGSGAWRRHPEGSWRTTAETVTRLAPLQRTILLRAAALVRPGGRLAYATCSVFAEENVAVAEDFAAAQPGFRLVPMSEAAATPDLTDAFRSRLPQWCPAGHMLQLTPRRSGTDGFFLALFERSA